MAHPTETPEQARQAERKGWISRVLVISTILAIVLIGLSYIFAV